MWVGYAREVLLGLDVKDGGGDEGRKGVYVTAMGVGSKLAGMDFHGAELEVVRCGCVGRVGCRGIVVRETRGVFVVVTRRNRVIGEYFLLP